MTAYFIVDENLPERYEAESQAVSRLDEIKASHRVRIRLQAALKSRDEWKARATKAEAKVQELTHWAGRMDHELSACLAREEKRK